jgi:TRAP transporter TAXI family solute receptor
MMRPQRHVASFGLLAGTIAALALLLAFAAEGIAQGLAPPQRIAFQISTGSTTGSYFPVGQLLAQVLSHPPGVGRCEASNVCGPAGLIVSTRASEGSISNVNAVSSGTVTSGIAQTDVVAQAVAGQGPFRRSGPAKDLRVIANLYGEDVHLLAAKDAKIQSVADLRGKRVSLSTEGSGTIDTARAVLAAYRLSERSIVPNYEPSERATDLLQSGKLDAMFYVGGAPAGLIEQLLDEGVAVLIPIDGDGRTRLLARQSHLYAHTIAQGIYSGTGDVETVAVDALWITDASEPDDLIYGVTKSLFNPANRAALNAERVGAHFIQLDSAAKGFTAPLHPGAARYFMEAGVLEPLPEQQAAAPSRGTQK